MNLRCVLFGHNFIAIMTATTGDDFSLASNSEGSVKRTDYHYRGYCTRCAAGFEAVPPADYKSHENVER